MTPIRLAVLGSTGSIGQQTLDVARRHPERLRVVALAAGENAALLRAQAAELKSRFVSCAKPGFASDGAECLSPELMASHPEIDIVVVALPGGAGLIPALAAARAGKIIALANKECLVAAGEILLAEAKAHGAQIRPVDSEHSAIWQCLVGECCKPEKLILTASGGPFRDYSIDTLESVTPEQALAHPSWKMGRKVTIDSATLMNKGLEVIEAHWLFGIEAARIEVLLHPQSLVHSMVEMRDGSVICQMGTTDMRLPIQYALTYPDRWASPLPPLDLASSPPLEFSAPDSIRFPCLSLAYRALEMGGTATAALNAANEVAVEAFLARRARFLDIPRVIEKVLEKHVTLPADSLLPILEADRNSRREAERILAKGAAA
jgi:1-deoxy-D-xylulose-5-phosphate reductoisomerase